MWHGFVITMQFLVISFCLPLQLTLRGKSITQSHRTPIYYVDLTLCDGTNLQDVIVCARQVYEASKAGGFNDAVEVERQLTAHNLLAKNIVGTYTVEKNTR